jgi:quercetin dioxygenase-like cupin family protein
MSIRCTRLFTDSDSTSRFEEITVPLTPEVPAPHELSVSAPFPAGAVLFAGAPAGGSHPEQPEARRQLIIGISGEVEISAGGETRVFRPGDVLLVEDTTGAGHSSRTSAGFTAAIVVLA